MNDDLTPLPLEAKKVLQAERGPMPAPSGVKSRVLERLQTGLVAGQGQGQHQATNVDVVRPVSALRRVWGARSGIGIFVAGGIAGALAHAWVAAMHTRPSDPEFAVPSSVAPPLPGPAEIESVGVQAPESAVPAPRGSDVATHPLSDSALGVERAMLDQARFAFSKGDEAAALNALGAHARKFPHGRLEEEREALAIKVLAGAGHSEEAKARLARFRTKFPESFLLPSLEESLRAIP